MSEAPPSPRPTHARADRLRARAGWGLAPLAALAVALAPMPSLSHAAHAMAVIDVVVVVLWVSEALPLWVPALLGPLAAAAWGVATWSVALAPFVHDLILLFFGGFVLAAALAFRGVDQRIALWTLSRRWVDGRPERARIAIAGVAFSFSMWISNTATAAMMVPIVLGLSAHLRVDAVAAPAFPEHEGHASRERSGAPPRDWTEGMLLTLAYAASLGGLCTPIGTAPNMLAVNHLREELGVQVDFFHWMRFAVPVGVAALVAVLVVARIRYPAPVARIEGLQARVREALRELGPARASQRRVVLIFSLAVALWILPAVLRLTLGEAAPATVFVRTWFNEGWVAVAAAFALVLVPHGERHVSASTGHALLTVRQALDIDWGTLILLGGGFSLGKLTFASGLAASLGEGVLALAPASFAGLLIAATTLVIYLTELTSNTATTSMLLPVITPAAIAAGYAPIPIALCVTMAASFAFMMPVSTPPNAIVYGTRRVRFGSMLGFGAWLDVIGLALLIVVGLGFLPQLDW